MSLQNAVIVISNYGMGNGPADLRLTLIGKYLQLLEQGEDLPAAICFYTEGVKLITDSSPILEQLEALEKRHVRLIICSTCLNYYNLTDQVKAGIVGSMGDILTAQSKAEKVIFL
jgi:intracellular sulfur oxidation DsrE/DsrF family protein